MNVLVIGKPKYNVYIPVDKYLSDGANVKFTDKLEMMGGASIYTALMLKKWGIDVAYAGCTSGDEIGTKLKKDLEDAGIDVHYLEMDFEHKTHINYIILNKENGQNTVMSYENDSYTTKYKYDYVPDFIVSDGSDVAALNGAINNYPTAKVILLANKLELEIESLAKRSHYICASLRFAYALVKLPLEFRNRALVNLMQKIKDLYKGQYTIMLNNKGVLYNNERKVKMIPAFPNQENVDLGNMDNAFFGAYAYGIINNLNIDEIAKIANIASSLSKNQIGINGIPSKEEVYLKAELKVNEVKENKEPIQTLNNSTQMPNISQENNNNINNTSSENTSNNINPTNNTSNTTNNNEGVATYETL